MLLIGQASKFQTKHLLDAVHFLHTSNSMTPAKPLGLYVKAPSFGDTAD